MSELPELVLGPVVRFVDPEEATVWVETDRPCEVQVLGASSSTFAVDGHHYALVRIGGLEPGSSHEYEVLLDGERRWPEPGSRLPPSTIRTPDSGGPIEVVFGSCRVALPHEPPFTLSKDEHPLGREHDALRTLALEMISGTRPRWPDLLLMLGDQVYVDEGSPRVREWIPSRRDARVPPGEEVANFAEYTRLYRESWGEPVMRWLLSVVPTAMVIDDHDMRSIFDDEEWRWVEDHATGDFDHLLIGTTDPFLLGPGLHYVEAWNEAVCEGTWGGAAARLGERMRRALDFDHWAAFQFSFHRLVELLEEVGAGRRGRPPATIAVLSGDVHHAYVADGAFRRDARVTSHVFQAVCSPFRNALDSHERLGVRIGMSRPGGTIARGLARAAGGDRTGVKGGGGEG